MKAVSVLAAIITAVFVFGQIAGAAGYAPPEAERAAGTIGGTIFLDADNDGVQGPGEQGMSGIAVHLRDAAGGQVATTETFSTPAKASTSSAASRRGTTPSRSSGRRGMPSPSPTAAHPVRRQAPSTR